MLAKRKRRRLDGTLRPTIARRRRRKAQERNAARDETPERRAWLANFEPGARQRFFGHVVLREAVFLSAFEETTGLPRDEAAALLERTAAERRWRKLRTLDGTVVGIAPPRGTRRKKPAPTTKEDDVALTDQQRGVLAALKDSEGPLTTHEVGEVIRRQFTDSPHGYYDRARSVLARLEKRGLVAGEKAAGRVSSWTPTRAGLDALGG